MNQVRMRRADKRKEAWGGLRHDPGKMSDVRLEKLHWIRYEHIRNWCASWGMSDEQFTRVLAGMDPEFKLPERAMWTETGERVVIHPVLGIPGTIKAQARQLLHIVCEQARRQMAPQLRELDAQRAALLRVLARTQHKGLMVRLTHLLDTKGYHMTASGQGWKAGGEAMQQPISSVLGLKP